MEENEDWATDTLKEAPFWRDGMSPEEYDEEREHLAKNYYYKEMSAVYSV